MKARTVFVLVLLLTLSLILTTGQSIAAQSIPNSFLQCANRGGICDWIGSNVTQFKGDYTDGMAVPQRIIFYDIQAKQPGLGTYPITFRHLWTKGSKHDYDFLVSWDQARLLSLLIKGLPMDF